MNLFTTCFKFTPAFQHLCKALHKPLLDCREPLQPDQAMQENVDLSMGKHGQTGRDKLPRDSYESRNMKPISRIRKILR